MEINKKDESLAEILNMKIYQCLECESAFARKDNLVSHISSVHEKKKPYECHSCDSAYAKKDNLKVHISAIHEGKKPNNCPICGQSFAQKTQMFIAYKALILHAIQMHVFNNFSTKKVQNFV